MLSSFHHKTYFPEVYAMSTDKPRYTVSVDDDLFKQIEDYRFENRFQTRSEATVELIRRGLEAVKKEQKKSAAKKA